MSKRYEKGLLIAELRQASLRTRAPSPLDAFVRSRAPTSRPQQILRIVERMRALRSLSNAAYRSVTGILVLTSFGLATALSAPLWASEDEVELVVENQETEESLTESRSEASAEWLFALAPHVGLAIPSSKLGLMAIGGLELDFGLPVLDYRLFVALDASYTKPSFQGKGTDARVGGDYSYEISEDILKFAIDLGFRLFSNDHFYVPWVSVGPALVLLRSSESSSIAPELSEQSTAVGVDLAGGLDLRLGPGFFFGALRYAWAPLDHTLSGESNAGVFSLALGYRILLL